MARSTVTTRSLRDVRSRGLGDHCPSSIGVLRAMELDEFRSSVDQWLDLNADLLAPDYAGSGSLDEQMTQISKTKRLAYDAGWMCYGWPEQVGGLGGSPLLRAYLGEALASRELVEPGLYSLVEVLAPTMIDYALPELAAAMVPRLLRGDETWCQGFSEPDTGSNLAALSCRAMATDDGWRVTGQKVWTSLAQYADRCVLLTRTGAPDSMHRGITALFVDMETPGISVRPLETMHGVEEFSEVFFDDVLVPFERTLGEVDHGWSVAMDLLPFERSTALWYRGAFLYQRLERLLNTAPTGVLNADEVGEVFEDLYALRALSRKTLHRLDSGERLGPETSVDKVLLATAEQALFDLVPDALPYDLLFADDEGAEGWRSGYLYSRAATIYGGSSEIQRNIIARRLLDLGDDR